MLSATRWAVRNPGPDCSVLAHFLDHAIALEQRAHLGFTESAVAAGSSNAADAPGGGPTGHRFRVDAEQRGHLAWCEQTISSVHSPLLASVCWSGRDHGECRRARSGRKAIRALPRNRVPGMRKKP